MSKVPLSHIFKVYSGNGLDLTVLQQCDETHEESVNYISRTRENNGVSAIVKKYLDIKPFDAGLISVAGSGNSVLESFIQPKPFYTGYHVFVLEPLNPAMTDLEKLFYCYCIRQNQYKYSYGRQANRTLKDLLVPSEMPEWAKEIVLPKHSNLSLPIVNKKLQLTMAKWGNFQIEDLFDVVYGANLEMNKMVVSPNGVPFVSRTSNNNGVSAYVEPLDDVKPNPAHTISISGGGSVLECFVQEKPYYSGRDLFYLMPKEPMNKNVLLFICTIIKKEKYRFNYGRQANKTLRSLTIYLPVTKKGLPDFEFMDRFIQSMPYSSVLSDSKSLSIPSLKVKAKGLSNAELIEKAISVQDTREHKQAARHPWAQKGVDASKPISTKHQE